MKKLFISLLIISLISCQPAMEQKSVDLNSLEKEIINNSKAFQLAYISNDYLEAKQFLSNEITTTIFNSNGSSLVEQSEEQISNSGRGWKFIRFDMKNHQVFIAPDAKSIAVIFDTEGEIEFENTGEKVPYSTRASQFWVSTSQGWKIMHSHWSPKEQAQGIPNE